MNVQELEDTLLARIRGETAGASYSQSLAHRVLSYCQQFVSIRFNAAVESDTLNTSGRQQIYDIRSYIPRVGRILAVRDGDRDLDFMLDWRELWYSGRRWFRRIDSQPNAFALIGHDLLVVHPAKEENSTVTVIHAKMTDQFVNPSDVVEVDDDDVPHVLDIAEAILLLRERRMEPLQSVLQNLQRKVATRRVES